MPPMQNLPPPLVNRIAPHFDNSTPTAVISTQARTVFLPCNVRHLGDRTVSWIRRTVDSGLNVLTVGRFTYTMDQRFQAVHYENSESWALQIKYPTVNDSGVYECQVSTTPKISRFVRLDIVVSKAQIVGGPTLYVNGGGVLRLLCQINGFPSGTEYVYWYRNGKVVNYDEDMKHRMVVSIHTTDLFGNSSSRILSTDINPKNRTHNVSPRAEAPAAPTHGPPSLSSATKSQREIAKLESLLVISGVTSADSGSYSCQPSNTLPDTIQVFVLSNDSPAAMHDSVAVLTSPAAVVRSRELLLSMLLLPLYLLR
ncbi:uncharacterized protein LOC100909192 [Galendromus occidentalis]|uniref:Uncharacterized protein LOC100909192 n=1 Tax=Galendromus occidentalis TaxID=34638 RepID=A0AAJ6VV34_9ACAR|nr:uncharacterized protein LOC100909192 [Galendromus occidentalis]